MRETVCKHLSVLAPDDSDQTGLVATCKKPKMTITGENLLKILTTGKRISNDIAQLIVMNAKSLFFNSLISFVE